MAEDKATAPTTVANRRKAPRVLTEIRFIYSAFIGSSERSTDRSQSHSVQNRPRIASQRKQHHDRTDIATEQLPISLPPNVRRSAVGAVFRAIFACRRRRVPEP